MYRAVIADEYIQGSDHSDQSRKSHRVPSTQVLVVQERGPSWGSWAHNPERDDDCEDAADVKTEEDTLDQRELYSQEGIEEDCVKDDRNCDQSSVPAGRYV